jgi:hypothetical protein
VVPQIGLAVARQRGRHRDDHRVDLGELGVAARGVQLRQHGLQPLRGDVLDVALATVDGGDPSRVHLDAEDVGPCLREGDGQGQAYIAHADDPDLHL